MSYVNPETVLDKMIQAGCAKAKLSSKDILIRGFLSGALLGYATSLAVTATIQTGLGIVGALIFPVGFVIIVLLGLELVTGNFALVPLALFEKKTNLSGLVVNWTLVFLGNLIGSLFYAWMFYLVVTKMGHSSDAPIIQKIISIAEMKTAGYSHWGPTGIFVPIFSGLLCNWMVTLGAVLFFTSSSTSGKILAMWLPIVIFFAQGYEHSVVNMFIIPAGMMLGAHVSIADWWLWNQIPVTLGNIFGGMIFTGMLLYLTYNHKRKVNIEVMGQDPISADLKFGNASPIEHELNPSNNIL